jgi:hypothetical protein
MSARHPVLNDIKIQDAGFRDARCRIQDAEARFKHSLLAGACILEYGRKTR